MSPWKIRRLALDIQNGAIFAYPTDTIWGLGCHPLYPNSVQRIQKIKQRSSLKGLILLSSDIKLLAPFLASSEINALQQACAKNKTTPISWICRTSQHCPRYLTGQYDTIAVRITDREPVNSLSRQLQSPLVSTSANISGHSTIRNHFLAHKQFQQRVDFIIEGFHSSGSRASQIRDLHSGQIIRP
jgi:L-threonylcarbamoyladenylate synthase